MEKRARALPATFAAAALIMAILPATLTNAQSRFSTDKKDQEIELQGILTSRTDNFTDTGYMVQASYFLSGENSSYGWVKPLRPFDPRIGQWGALDLAARVSNVATQTRQFQLGFANPSLSAKTATEFAVGINWYLNSNIKYYFDYANTYFYQGAGTVARPTDRPNESVFESQVQLAF